MKRLRIARISSTEGSRGLQGGQAQTVEIDTAKAMSRRDARLLAAVAPQRSGAASVDVTNLWP